MRVSSRDRLRPGIGVVLFILALIPLAGTTWFATQDVREASEQAASASDIQDTAEHVRHLVTLRAALTDERIWTYATVAVAELGLPPDIVSDMVNIDLLAEIDRSHGLVDAALAHPHLTDYEEAIAALRDFAATEGTDPNDANDAFLGLDTELRRAVTDELDRLEGLAALQPEGRDLVVTARVLELTSDLNEAANAQLSAYFGASFPTETDRLDEIRRLLDTVALYETSAEAMTATVDAGSQAGQAWEAIRDDPQILLFAELVDATIDRTMREGLAELGNQPIADAIANPETTAEAFLAARTATAAHLDLVAAAADDITAAADERFSAAESNVQSSIVTAALLAAVTLIAALFAGRLIIRPLQKMGAVSGALRSGDLDEMVDERGPKEVRSAARALNEAVAHLRLAERQATALADEQLDDPVLAESAPGQLGAALQRSVEHLATSLVEREEFRRRLAYEAAHDGLTGLPNRSASLAHLSRSLARTRRADTDLAVMFIDLDGFKRANDLHGHPVGDRLLKLVAQRLVTSVREGDLVGRLGGDEFLVIAEPVDGVEEALEIAHRLRAAIAEPTVIETVDWTPSASIGVAMGAEDLTADELLRDADLAVYQAKARGGASVELCNEDLRGQLVARADLELALREAIDRDELTLYYQSTVDARTGATSGLEALVRWNRPGMGLQPPDSFIPIAERSDLIVALDRWVLGAAARQLAAWTDHPLLGRCNVAVNVSGRHLGLDGLVEDVIGPLELHGVEPSRLTIEVTESALLADLNRAAVHLEQLRRRGIRVAIDDFGTGYTSLAHLRTLPIDILKIDRSFTARITDDGERSLVKLIVDTGHLLGVTITVEGVETPEQADVLTELGSDTLQGYRFSRPVPPAELIALLEPVVSAGDAS
ncbi:MAG: EAL domain-containing protein [Acidimicrobiales bacterium]|nr:EAL domain-containing protein [Acidimicrobiales bacterium]